MIKYEFDFPKRATETEDFAEASANELKVLIALMEAKGEISDEELSEISGVSKARVTSAIALWQESGVIAPKEHNKEVSFFGNSVSHEFAQRTHLEELEEESAKSIAKNIRDKKLASLFDEIANMMSKTMLTPQEIKKISELSSQYELSEEYIATLAAHLLAEGNLSVGILVRRAINLVGAGIITAEHLSLYLAEKEREKNDYIEYRRILGIYDRKFSQNERELLHKWSYDFSYGTEIISMAYDICVMNTNKVSFRYMDKLLTDWHEKSCTTAEECEKRYCERKEELDKEAEKKRADMEKRRPSQPKPAKQRYGNFDPEEAFRLALDRSFAGRDED